MDNSALFKLGYGLYVLTANENGRDNGCIINTAMQISSSNLSIGAIAVNKQNYTHDMILKTKKFNISILTTETPFEVFKHFGFNSGTSYDKFAGYTDIARSENGITYLTKHTNAFLSFDVLDTMDFDSHTMFKSNIMDGKVLDSKDSVTYAYYHQNIKPKSEFVKKSGGHRCVICNYVYEGDVLPLDFICPICKHGISDFVKI
ncbi:MAG: flavin reductase [Defluviitaleaceae bacterium]|nr:flavin reductase [Defluviitaleaceae bacterium]